MRSQSISIFLAVLLSILGTHTFGSDGDSLTQRSQILSDCTPDATCVVNAIINRHFELALEKVNRKSCPTQLDLERAILDQVGDKKVLGITVPVGSLEKPIEKGFTTIIQVNNKPLSIPSFNIDRDKSIYADAKLLESPGVVFGMASHLKIGNLVIGSDKLTHFFAQGYEYIEVERKCGTQAAVKQGIESESGKYGLSANGIYSYGDLAANYCGCCFWRNLTHSEYGHFKKCHGKWVQTRKFCWRRYVNPAWDEGINPPCGPAVERTRPYVARLVRCNRIPHAPPLQTESIPTILEFYPAWVIPLILNPKTHAFLHGGKLDEIETLQDEKISSSPIAPLTRN